MRKIIFHKDKKYHLNMEEKYMFLIRLHFYFKVL